MIINSDTESDSEREGELFNYDDNKKVFYPNILRNYSNRQNSLIAINNTFYLHKEGNHYVYNEKMLNMAFQTWKEQCFNKKQIMNAFDEFHKNKLISSEIIPDKCLIFIIYMILQWILYIYIY